MIDIETLDAEHYAMVWSYGFGWSLYGSTGLQLDGYVGAVDMSGGLTRVLDRFKERGYVPAHEGSTVIWLDKGGSNE